MNAPRRANKQGVQKTGAVMVKPLSKQSQRIKIIVDYDDKIYLILHLNNLKLKGRFCFNKIFNFLIIISTISCENMSVQTFA